MCLTGFGESQHTSTEGLKPNLLTAVKGFWVDSCGCLTPN